MIDDDDGVILIVMMIDNFQVLSLANSQVETSNTDTNVG